MPEQISVSDFLQEAWDDYNSPTTSNFIDKISVVRQTISCLEEGIDVDRSNLTRLKKSVKALYSNGSAHAEHEVLFYEHLERLSQAAKSRDQETLISEAFKKYSIVVKELSDAMKTLLKSLQNTLMYPLDTFLKGDLRGVKGDLKKPFEKSWKEYESKFLKLEKELKQNAREAGMFKKEVTGAEVAEEMEKERRMFQLQACEYLLKVNEIRTKKGADLLQHLTEYYHSQMKYFKEGLQTLEYYKVHVDELTNQLVEIRQSHDAERRKLAQLRDALKSSMGPVRESSASGSGGGYSLHQLQGNKEHGNERSGYLLKKSEGKMRRVWQKRKCTVKDGCLSISHSDMSKEPVRLNLLTCQVKLVFEDPGKKCFDLISSSNNRTYHFQAEDTLDMEHWISVLNNAKQAVLMQAFGQNKDQSSKLVNQSVKELTNSIIHEIRQLPGNNLCADCSAEGPEWVSVNLGVLICLECCGVHRDMGVHISRTQSIVIDELGTSQLLLARAVSNQIFNETMEATLEPSQKPTPTSDMEERKQFIRAKYERKRYAFVTNANIEERCIDLKQAVTTKDLQGLIQVFAEGIDLMETLDDTNDKTALHLAIEQEDGRSLYMVDFIAQNANSTSLCKADANGNNVLHVCATLDRPECMKILLRLQPDLVNYENRDGFNPLQIAQNNGNNMCIALIKHAMEGKMEMFQNINIDWGLISEDHCYDDYDYSDDDLDRCQTPDRRVRSRPGSLILGSDVAMARENGPGDDGLEEGRSSTLLHGQDKRNRGTMSGNLSSSVQSLNINSKKKMPAPAPPPPSYRQNEHSRKHSDPGCIRRSFESLPTGPKPGPDFIPPPHEYQSRPPKNSMSSLPGDSPPPLFPKTKRPNTHFLGSHQPFTNIPSPKLPSKMSVSPKFSDSDDTPPALPPKQHLSPVNERGADPAVLKPGMKTRALYDCAADNDDELSFSEGEFIILKRQEEEEWWEGHIANDQSRRGVFPISFVTVVDEQCIAQI